MGRVPLSASYAIRGFVTRDDGRGGVITTGGVRLLSDVGFSDSGIGTKGTVPKDNRVGEGCRGEESESLHSVLVGVVAGDED